MINQSLNDMIQALAGSPGSAGRAEAGAVMPQLRSQPFAAGDGNDLAIQSVPQPAGQASQPFPGGVDSAGY